MLKLYRASAARWLAPHMPDGHCGCLADRPAVAAALEAEGLS